MSFWNTLGVFFKKVGALLGEALQSAAVRGLTDDIIKIALEWVKVAALQELSNDERREFVVQILVNKGIPESIARLAIELAVQLLKKELAKAI